MENISQEISKATQDYLESEELKAHIAKKAKDAVNSIVDDQFSYRGLIKEKIKAAVEKAMEGMGDFSADQFVQLCQDAIQSELNGAFKEWGEGRIAEKIRQMTTKLKKKDWKYSELVEQMKAMCPDDDEFDEDTEIYFEVSEDRKILIHSRLYYTKGTGYSSIPDNYWNITIRPEDNTLFSIEYMGYKDERLALHRDEFTLLLYRIWANKGTIELDEDQIERYWPEKDRECYCE